MRNQITQLFQRALKSWKHLVETESLQPRPRSTPRPLPQCGSSPRTGTLCPTARASTQARSTPAVPGTPFLSLSSVRRGNSGSGRPRGSSISAKGKGEERGEAGGGSGRSFSAARSSGGDRGGGAPFPRALIAVASRPSPPACVRGASALGRPDGGNRGFRGR